MSDCFVSFFQHGADDVKRHRWFKNIIWEDVYYKKVQVRFPRMRSRNMKFYGKQLHLSPFCFRPLSFGDVCGSPIYKMA